MEVTRKAFAAGVAADDVESRARDLSAVIGEILSAPAGDRPRLVTLDERYLQPAVAQAFSKLAVAEWGHNLNDALAHISVATSIALALVGRIRQIADLQFEIWKNASTIHRERGEFDAARAALVHAAQAAEHSADRDLNRAIVNYAQAAICAEPDVASFDEAHALLGAAEPVLAHRDARRARHALTLRGVIYARAGEHERAHAVWTRVLQVTPSASTDYVDALRNVASSSHETGRLREAGDAVRRVIQMEETAVRSPSARTVHVAGRIAGALENLDEAVRLLSDAMDGYGEAGDVASLLHAGKDLAVTHVAAGRIDLAREVLSKLLTKSVGDSERLRFTAEALAYLRELADCEVLSPELAVTVSAYVDRVHDGRVSPFVEPWPLRPM